MRLALVKPTETVRSQGLHDANVDVCVVVMEKGIALYRNERGECVQIMIKQLLAHSWWKIGLGIEQKRSHIVLQSAFAATLVVHEKWLSVAQHDVARLEIAVKKVVAICTQQEFG